MTEKQIREKKVKEILKVVKSDVGEDDDYFDRYQNILDEMNSSELDLELQLIMGEKNLK